MSGKKKLIKKDALFFLMLVLILLALILCSIAFKMASRNVDIRIWLDEAEDIARIYDYDGAIALLEEKQSGLKLKSSELEKQTAVYHKAKEHVYEDNTKIPHIFFHSLIVDTDLAFNSPRADSYNKDMATVSEFKNLLKQLYENNYVLVGEHDIGEETENGFVPKPIYLPEGKRPIVISQDDVNYYVVPSDAYIGYEEKNIPDAPDSYDKNMPAEGFATRLVVDDGKVMCEYTDAKGTTSVGAYDLIPILDNFVSAHPDFSYQGAKAVIAVTGFNGVFGYHNIVRSETSVTENPEASADEIEKSNKKINASKRHNSLYQEECKAVREVAQCLRDSGYELASHTYYHIHCSEQTKAEMQRDINDWQENIGSLISDSEHPVDILIYPHGEDLTYQRSNTPEAVDIYEEMDTFQPLYDAGFRYFCNIDARKSSVIQDKSQDAFQSSQADAPVQFCTKYMRHSRKGIDGYRLTYPQDYLYDIFYDLDAIYDKSRPLQPAGYSDEY